VEDAVFSSLKQRVERLGCIVIGITTRIFSAVIVDPLMRCILIANLLIGSNSSVLSFERLSTNRFINGDKLTVLSLATSIDRTWLLRSTATSTHCLAHFEQLFFRYYVISA
jgi:hypothetical protein